jgi:hypothetical protein
MESISKFQNQDVRIEATGPEELDGRCTLTQPPAFRRWGFFMGILGWDPNYPNTGSQKNNPTATPDICERSLRIEALQLEELDGRCTLTQPPAFRRWGFFMPDFMPIYPVA